MTYDQIVIQDSETGQKYSVTITNGVLSIADTEDDANFSEIIHDLEIDNTAWTLAIADGLLNVTVSETVSDSVVVITDGATGEAWRLLVSGGQFGYTNGIRTIWAIDISFPMAGLAATSAISQAIAGDSEFDGVIAYDSFIDMTIDGDSGFESPAVDDDSNIP